MKKLFWGFAAIIFAIIVVNSAMVGCSSSKSPAAPAPVTVTCSGSFGYAYTGSSTTSSTGYIQAEGVKIVSSASVTAYSLGLFVVNSTAPGLIRAAIYGGTTAGPTTLISQSAPQSMVLNAWNEIPIPSASLSAGYYWLAFQAPGLFDFDSDFTSTSGAYFTSGSTVTFGAFASTMPTGTVGTFPYNFYVNTCP